MNVFTELNKTAESLEQLLLNSGYDGIRLEQIKLDYFEKHEYLQQDYNTIAFFDDYISHLIELKKVYGGVK